MRYLDTKSGAVVLQSTESEAGIHLDLYDLYYWTFLMNGEYVTNDQMSFMNEDGFTFKADPILGRFTSNMVKYQSFWDDFTIFYISGSMSIG